MYSFVRVGRLSNDAFVNKFIHSVICMRRAWIICHAIRASDPYFFFWNIYSCNTEHVAELFLIPSFSSHTFMLMLMLYFEHEKWKTFLQVWHSKPFFCFTLNRKCYCLSVLSGENLPFANNWLKKFAFSQFHSSNWIIRDLFYLFFTLEKRIVRLKKTICPIAHISETLQMLLTRWQNLIFYSVAQWIFFCSSLSQKYFPSPFPCTFAVMSHFNDIMVNHYLVKTQFFSCLRCCRP